MALIRPQFESTTWQAFERTVLKEEKPAVVAAELGMSINAVLLAKCRVMNRLRREMRGWTDNG